MPRERACAPDAARAAAARVSILPRGGTSTQASPKNVGAVAQMAHQHLPGEKVSILMDQLFSDSHSSPGQCEGR